MEAMPHTVRRIAERVQAVLEVLTPVHIGCGIRWQKNLDFVVDKETYVIPEHVLMTYLQEHPESLADFEDEQRRAELLWETEGGIEYELPCRSREILVFMRNGNGQPYVPGSSLKGALRTVIFRHFWEQLDQGRKQRLLAKTGEKRESAAQPLVREVLGRDPNHDLLRVLAVFDTPVHQEDLDLYRLFILNLTDPKGRRYGWRNVPRKRSFSDIRDATPIYAEMLRPGTQGVLSLRLDRFLLDDERAERELHFSDKLSLEQLARWANRHARHLLKREQAFLEQCGNGRLQRLLDSIDSLVQLIPAEDTPEEGKRFLLRLGWSSGWRSMTGDYLEEENLNEIRKKYGLNYDRNKNQLRFPVFPKTRKIVFDGEEPSWLAGWVQIRLDADIQQAKKSASEVDTEARSSRPQMEITTSGDVPQDYETGVVHNLKLSKGYGTILSDKGGEPIRFDFATADMTGLEKGARVRFRLVKEENQYRAVDVKKVN
ncbi:type III-A CRISPR-associated RAMP protein Csm5 [Rhodothermus marinus]|uniref:CRISPR system Cms protein Csm5 n=1 Tax=Rhodothermus marinus (strain ATCC 43812 / DSM 4252 / R-10) TaxID=518766 RepID=D0MJ61_RHOM4|nr:type III-A CRISPR-associated RAMP protein Csm5 [Rhodothermus marinus]ACY48519.1 CRISPR-associated RAMP protein, Csm5 family [Rhodothermus marinus DSM 4252]